MQTMDDALLQLVQSGRIAPEDAYRKATDKSRFERFAPSE
jgi:twitching motility protein PilT